MQPLGAPNVALERLLGFSGAYWDLAPEAASPAPKASALVIRHVENGPSITAGSGLAIPASFLHCHGW